jgi:hypothetical protein
MCQAKSRLLPLRFKSGDDTLDMVSVSKKFDNQARRNQ